MLEEDMSDLREALERVVIYLEADEDILTTNGRAALEIARTAIALDKVPLAPALDARELAMKLREPSPPEHNGGWKWETWHMLSLDEAIALVERRDAALLASRQGETPQEAYVRNMTASCFTRDPGFNPANIPSETAPEGGEVNWDEIDDDFDQWVNLVRDDIPGESYERSYARRGGEWMRHLIKAQLARAPHPEAIRSCETCRYQHNASGDACVECADCPESLPHWAPRAEAVVKESLTTRPEAIGEVEEAEFQRDETCRMLNDQIDKTKEARAEAEALRASLRETVVALESAFNAMRKYHPYDSGRTEAEILTREIIQRARAALARTPQAQS